VSDKPRFIETVSRRYRFTLQCVRSRIACYSGSALRRRHRALAVYLRKHGVINTRVQACVTALTLVSDRSSIRQREPKSLRLAP
jgi:hypothetical protein